MLAPWAYCVGFVLTYTPLFAKMWRVSKTLARAKQQRRLVVVQPWRLYRLILLVASVELLVLLAWSATNPLRFVRETTARQEGTFRPTESVGQCKVREAPPPKRPHRSARPRPRPCNRRVTAV